MQILLAAAKRIAEYSDNMRPPPLQLRLQGTNSGYAHRGRRSAGSGTGFGVLPKTPTSEYLKNIVLQYLATDEPEKREHMEGAIATVLQFSDDDIAFVREKRDGKSWASSLTEGISGLFGGSRA